MPLRFHEVQRFRQVWIWALLAPPVIVAWFGFIQQIVFGIPFGTKPGPDLALWLVWLLVGIGVPVLFWKAKLEIRVHDDRLNYHWFPILNRSVPLSDIKSATARTYRPIREYGGWGLRYGGKKKGWAYNIRGDRGVFIECHDGKCFLLGSEEADKLADAINEFLG